MLKPSALGLPANLGGVGFFDTINLAAYAVKPTKGAPKPLAHGDVRVANACGETAVTTTKPVNLLFPSALDLAAPVAAPNEADHDVDHFLCYRGKEQKKLADGTPLAPFPKGVQVVVGDQFQTRRYDLKKVVELCSPVSKSGNPILLGGPTKGMPVAIGPATISNPESHLLCYQTSLARKLIAQNGCGPANPSDKGTAIVPPQAPHSPRVGMHIGNQLGPARLDSSKNALLCVPSTLPAP